MVLFTVFNCKLATDPQSSSVDSFDSAQLEALHHVSILNNKRFQKELPLLFLLHGYGSNEQDLIGLFDDLKKDYNIFSFRAPNTMSINKFNWYPIQIRAGEVFSIEDSLAHTSLEQIYLSIRSIREKYDAATNNCFMAGFSQGGIMTLSFAMKYPKELKGAIVMSGMLPDWKSFGIPNITEKFFPDILMTHGNLDQKIKVDHAELMDASLKAMGSKRVLKKYNMGHTIARQAQIDIKKWLQDRK